MVPAWTQLAETFNAEGSNVVIADVDCTAEGGQEVCHKYEVQGYPTIKYFSDGDTEGKPYNGGRDFDTLEAFVSETLLVKCSPDNTKDCTDKEKAYVEKMKAKTAEERQKQIDRLSGMKGDTMKAELKQWLVQRLRILTALGGTESEEL